MTNRFNITVIHVMMMDAVQIMNDVLVVVWIQIRYDCPHLHLDGASRSNQFLINFYKITKIIDSLYSISSQQRSDLEKVLDKANGRQAALFSTVADQFELCLAKCRTDSNSVRHENKYKNPNFRYCYVHIDVNQ